MGRAVGPARTMGLVARGERLAIEGNTTDNSLTVFVKVPRWP